jgi:hypothetical protein
LARRARWSRESIRTGWTDAARRYQDPNLLSIGNWAADGRNIVNRNGQNAADIYHRIGTLIRVLHRLILARYNKDGLRKNDQCTEFCPADKISCVYINICRGCRVRIVELKFSAWCRTIGS